MCRCFVFENYIRLFSILDKITSFSGKNIMEAQYEGMLF